MRLTPRLEWSLEGEATEPLDRRLLPLLDAIATGGSLAAATVECDISYRAAWGLLRDYQRKFGAPLVELGQGRRATLAPIGKRLLDTRSTAMRRFAPLLPSLALDIGTRGRRASPRRLALRIAASYDLVLAALSQQAPIDAALDLDVSFMGSLDALAVFSAGRTQIAGFHVPLGDGRWDRTPFHRLLKARGHSLVRLVDRQQGLILPRGNPARIKKLSDVASQGLRFVNRQPGSGTRLIIDQLLAHDSVDPATLRGFRREEFTDPAVAATVASGGADAGFGSQAAAAEHGLAFIPVVRERYFFAVRTMHLKSPGIMRLIALLRSAQFARLASSFTGYLGKGAGTVGPVKALTATK
jgi:molybdate transport repressor ModE-like protein